MKKLASVLIILVLASLLGLNLVSAQDVDRTGWPETFIIGVYPGDNVEAAIAGNQPLADYLSSVLGIRTVIITGTSYGTVIEAMRAGRADAFEVGPFSYVLAAQIANAEAIVVGNYTTTVDLTTMPGYYSVLFTQKGSGITSIDDLAGKTFAFTDPASTSGFLIPATDVMDAEGFDSKDQIDTFFGQVIYAGSHPASVIAVANGTVDAGATFDDNLADQVEAGYKICGVESGDHAENVFHHPMTEDEIMAIYNDCPDGDIAVFHQSPLIPQTPFAVDADLPQSFKDAVKAALLDIANHQELIEAMNPPRFYVDPLTIDSSLTSVDALYDGLRNTAVKLDLDLAAR